MVAIHRRYRRRTMAAVGRHQNHDIVHIVGPRRRPPGAMRHRPPGTMRPKCLAVYRHLTTFNPVFHNALIICLRQNSDDACYHKLMATPQSSKTLQKSVINIVTR